MCSITNPNRVGEVNQELTMGNYFKSSISDYYYRPFASSSCSSGSSSSSSNIISSSSGSESTVEVAVKIETPEECGERRTMSVQSSSGGSGSSTSSSSSSSDCAIPSSKSGTTIEHLYPEIMTEIFLKLSLKDLGAAARTCRYWNGVLNDKRLWRGVEAKINVSKGGNQLLFGSLARRGIFDVQVLSLKRSLREMTASLPGIRSLKLSGCYNVTDGTISSGFSLRLECLTVLNLSLCKQVSDFSLGRIAIMAVNLQSLDLGGCCQITNRGLLMVSWGLKKLTKLNLRSCYLITDTGIGFLAGVVNQSQLQEPRMHDFLLKFGLVDLPEIEEDDYYDYEEVGSGGGGGGLLMQQRRRKIPRQRLHQQQLLYLQQAPPNMIQSASVMIRDKDNTNLTAPLTQQCAICKQEIKVKYVHDSQQQQQQSLQHPQQSSAALSSFNKSMRTTGTKRSRTQLHPQQLLQQHPQGGVVLPLPRTSSNNNGSNNCNLLSPPSSPPPLPLPSSNNSSYNKKRRNYVIVEKITPGTEFGNTELRTLILQDCQKLSDDCLNHLTNLGRLEAINLSFCVHITDSGLRNLGACSSLCEINLRSCENITDSGLANLTYDLSSRLTSLDVSFCDKVHNAGLNYISQFAKLRTLSMGSCAISDDGLIRVASSLTKLETLNIGQCKGITDASLKVIGEKCQELKYMDVYGCPEITPGGLAFAMKLPKLRHINLGLWHIR